MNKLIPLQKFVGKINKDASLLNTSVVVNKEGTPLGFVFGRDSFITFLERIDAEFEKKVSDPKKAFYNPAGRLIDLIEEKLPLNPDFIKDLKISVKNTGEMNWITLSEIAKYLHV